MQRPVAQKADTARVGRHIAANLARPLGAQVKRHDEPCASWTDKPPTQPHTHTHTRARAHTHPRTNAQPGDVSSGHLRARCQRRANGPLQNCCAWARARAQALVRACGVWLAPATGGRACRQMGGVLSRGRRWPRAHLGLPGTDPEPPGCNLRGQRQPAPQGRTACACACARSSGAGGAVAGKGKQQKG